MLEEMRNASLTETGSPERKLMFASVSSLEVAETTSVRVPCAIYVVMSEAQLYGYFGVEDSLRLINNWRQMTKEIIDSVMDSNPYVYDKEECLSKVFALKERFEELNSTLLNPIPVKCIAVAKAEFDALPVALHEILTFCGARKTTLYFSHEASEYLQLSAPLYNQISAKQVPPKARSEDETDERTKKDFVSVQALIEGKKACFLDKRVFSFRSIKDTNRVILKEALVCILELENEKQYLAHLKTLSNPGQKSKVFVCVPQKAGAKYLLFSFWSTLDFSLLYKEWSQCNGCMYLSRCPELVLSENKDGLYKQSENGLFYQFLQIKATWPGTLCVNPFVVPYVENLNLEKHEYTEKEPAPGLAACRVYQRKELVFCDLDCALKRIARLESSVQGTL